jgi:hypothetical protein
LGWVGVLVSTDLTTGRWVPPPLETT